MYLDFAEESLWERIGVRRAILLSFHPLSATPSRRLSSPCFGGHRGWVEPISHPPPNPPSPLPPPSPPPPYPSNSQLNAGCVPLLGGHSCKCLIFTGNFHEISGLLWSHINYFSEQRGVRQTFYFDERCTVTNTADYDSFLSLRTENTTSADLGKAEGANK